MKFARKYVAYLLAVALPLSALASTGAPCTQHAGSISGAATDMVDRHAHHEDAPAATEGSADGSTRHAAHHATADASAAECPCCDDCETTCVLSSCSPIALATPAGLMTFSGADTRFPSAEVFRDGPPPHVLFRPPIFPV